MAEVKNGWLLFEEGHSARLSQVDEVYKTGEDACRVLLLTGAAFYVQEPYEKVMDVIVAAEAA